MVSIDGQQICDKQSFLSEFAKKLHFPDYFGHNWDAFNDCLTDLSWLGQHDVIIIIYRDSQVFRNQQPENWGIANAILLDAIDYWRRKQVSMIVMFS